MRLGIDRLARPGRRVLVARAVGLAPAAQALAQVARSGRRQGVIVVLVVGHQRVPWQARGVANATRTAAHARPAAEAAGGEKQGNYLPGLVPVVDGAFAPLVPLVLLPGAVVLLEEPGVLLELLELLLGELPDVPEAPAPDVVSVEAEPETEAEPEVPGVALVLLGDEVELLLLVSDGGVLVLGVVLLVDDELLGVEPVLPLPLLLQPVAATEAKAIAATRGIRCFMTSSPIRFTCVEEMLSRMIRALGALRPACAASTREQR
jgi:hypothetical protein